ncbi:MAG: thiamine-phosphate pyrophosphorylase [Candidatus Omnitrophota bacterium]|nr:MAG: thiamine-phosphate pyrophosphorylase [Candidatus Omnitrophota bacterium]
MDKRILRVVDANFNRCKEGLRVVEDIFRFILCDDATRRKVRTLRHALDTIAKEKMLREAIATRNSRYDLGKNTDTLEIKRKDVGDILYTNLQRAKESLRVLEEFFKIVSVRKVEQIKKLRYEIYSLEKKIISRWPPVRNPRQRGS